MLCPSCHTLNRENARFCKGCGQILAVETIVTEGSKAPAPPASQSRDVTVKGNNAPAVSESMDVTVKGVKTPPTSQSADTRSEGDKAPPVSQSVDSVAEGGKAPPASVVVDAGAEGSKTPSYDAEEDLSLAPTQRLTPAQMMQYH